MTDPAGAEASTPAERGDSTQVNFTGVAEETQWNDRLAIVIVTRNRQNSLLKTLSHVTALEQNFPVVVFDNASEDGTARAVESQFPDVRLVVLEKNYGAVARNFGLEVTDQPYIAFCDDDSWWAYGSLSQAIETFDAHACLGLIMSKILVEPGGRYDPCCQTMADSPLPNRLNLPGFPILGFIACGTIVRRSAFQSAGGFNPEYGTWGEEELLAIDMAKNGWGLSYIPDIVAHHHPSKASSSSGRKRQEVRNNLWTHWLRRAPSSILHMTGKYANEALRDQEVFAGLVNACKGAGWVIRKRDPVPAWLESLLELKETRGGNC